MKKLCFGTLFTLLCQIKIKGDQTELYRALVRPYDTSGTLPDSGDTSNRKKGQIDISPDDKAYFSDENVSIEDIVISYRKGLASFIKNTDIRKAFVVAVQDVIKEDSSLNENSVIGTKTCTKNSILNMQVFDFFGLIANLMIYCSSIKNDGYEKEIKEITKTFVEDRLPSSAEIKLENSSFEVQTPLIASVDKTLFGRTFIEVNPNIYSLGIANPNKISIYKLNVTNNEFDYANLVNFIQSNIACYIYSRTKRKDIETVTNLYSVGIKALIELNNSKYKNSTENFCEIMLYSFLECALNSPKILSGFEIDKTTFNTKSSGVYLLPAGTVSNNNQIIFGCSKVHDSIKEAIDDVMEQSMSIKNNRNEEIKLLDPSILKANLEPDIAQYIKNIIVPSKSSSPTPDDAFGIFLAYTINIDGKDAMNNMTYRIELEKKMDEDIKSAIPYIIDKISSMELGRFSFYFFVLPLNNANTDPNSIMNHSTGGSAYD